MSTCSNSSSIYILPNNSIDPLKEGITASSLKILFQAN